MNGIKFKGSSNHRIGMWIRSFISCHIWRLNFFMGIKRT